MIIPCMNSTSACDCLGSVPFVDGGSVLLGLPGAPGCTTAGVAVSVCCAHNVEGKRPGAQKIPVRALAARKMQHRILRRCRPVRLACRVIVNPRLVLFGYDVRPKRMEK